MCVCGGGGWGGGSLSAHVICCCMRFVFFIQPVFGIDDIMLCLCTDMLQHEAGEFKKGAKQVKDKKKWQHLKVTSE